MGIHIDKTTKILGGVSVPGFYLRLEPTLNANGKQLDIKLLSYLNKDAYDAGESVLNFNLPSFIVFNYDRETDGADQLKAAHKFVGLWLDANSIVPANLQTIDVI